MKPITGLALYFGKPGCGKSTLLAKFALDGVKSYPHVYCNSDLNIPGVIRVNRDDIGTYRIDNGLLLIDEGQLSFDNRAWNAFDQKLITYFSMYRHFNMRICIFSQSWDGLDKKLRQLTNEVYYVYKKGIFGRWQSRYYRIPYDIIIPDPKQGGDKVGQIVQGYCKPDFLTRLFSHRIWRPKYYRYFDSFCTYDLPDLPQGYDGFKMIAGQQDEDNAGCDSRRDGGVEPQRLPDSADSPATQPFVSARSRKRRARR